MSLSVSTLSDGIVAMLGPGNFPPDTTDAGQRWADAYATYAQDGWSPVGAPPTGLSAKKPALAAALTTAFDARDANTTASAIDSALTAFWLSPPVVFPSSPPGGVTAVGGTGSLEPALLAVFAANVAGSLSNQDCADAIADAIDTFTRTVIITIPTIAVGPIS